MNVALVLNEGARAFTTPGECLDVDALTEEMRRGGFAVQPRITSSRELTQVLQEVATQRPDVIFVGGGDGSISTAAHVLAGTGLPLGVLPLGTLNHFARDLGVPLDWREAIAALAAGATRPIDVGEVNGRIFINNCSLGSYAEAVRKRDLLRRMHGAKKWWAMTLATIAVFRRLRRIRVRVVADGKTLSLRSPFVVIANNRYSGRLFDHSLRPRLDEGRLWLYSTPAARHATILRVFWQALRRKLHEIDGLDTTSAVRLTLQHDYSSQPVAIDGELASLEPPLAFAIRPRALHVIVPQQNNSR